ncbi:MAG: DUF2846 domain-containing protein [Proteobacteria bacterium]|nr:DUF2846 domain-containing protein [Pseudomonadota bacterium]
MSKRHPVLNHYSLSTFIVLCALVLPACSSTSERGTFTPLAAVADQSVVYIYRPSAASNAMYSPDLYLNDEYKLTIKNGKKARLVLAPGNYKFELEPGSNYEGLTKTSMALAPEETYYIRLDTTLKINSSSNFEPYRRSFNMINVEEALAIKQIAECCSDENRKTEVKAGEKEKNKDEQFSVDKTQNPFSH